MKRLFLACFLGTSFMLGGCFSPKIDLGSLDNLIKIDKKDGDKDKKEDRDKKKTKDD